MYNEYDLDCRYDARQSFYGKARVRVYNNGNEDLISYSTVVATKRNGKIKVNGWYSQTTGRHINEYLKQNDYLPMTKKQMESEEQPKKYR